MDTYRFSFEGGADITVKASDVPSAVQVFLAHWPNLRDYIVSVSREDS